MHVTFSGAAVAAVLVVAATAVVGCSADSSAGTRANSPSAAADEYRSEQPALTLAPGWDWPKSVEYPKTGPDGAGMVYQSGYGTTQADHYWYCSWERHLVEGEPSGSRRAETLQELESVRETHMYIHDIIDIDRPMFNEILDGALQGNLELMRRDVRLNCPDPTLLTAKATDSK